jgi:glycosyltransferase involved in cell wall biosynthesis
MKPIRVLQVLTVMVRGGAETMVMNHYRKIDREKVQFDFLVHREERSDFDDEIESLGGKIHRMPQISVNNYFAYKEALSDFFETHPEYKVVHSHINGLGYWVLKMAKQKGVPIRIAHSHNAYAPWYKKVFLKNADLKATLKTTIQSVLKYGTRNSATHYFACGEKAGRWMFGANPIKEIEIINNAIDSSTFKYVEQECMEIKKELGWDGKKVIGHVGSFTEAKNHFFVLNIFNEICKKENDIILILVGDGIFRKKIEKQIESYSIQDKVVLMGVQQDIPKLVKAFDLFLFPSLYEGLPVTLLEAQASGLRIVLSENISREVELTDLMTFVGLDISSEQWATIVINNMDYKREDTSQILVEKKYDVNENAKKLQELYLKGLSY